MNWLAIVLKNASRRKLRTLAPLLGVAIAVAALFSLLSFQRGYRLGMQKELDHLGAHILVVPKGCPYNAASMALHGASWPCYLKEVYLARVRRTPGVSQAAPLLMNAVYDDKTGAQSVYLGAEPDLLALKTEWHIQGRFPTQGDDCLVGSAVADTLRLKPGQRFALPGMPGTTGTVVGMLAPTHGADDTFIYVPLAYAQQIFRRPHQLTHILVRLQDPNRLDAVVGGLRSCEAGMEMNVVPLTHLFHTIQDLVNSTRLLLGCVALIALLVAGAGVSNTILMAVSERTREIGVMRAVGASAGDIFRLIWLETLLVCALGGLLGIAGARGFAPWLESWLRDRLPFSPSGSLIRPELGVMMFCLLSAIALGNFAGLLPAWRAARLSPSEAIRVGGG